MSHLSLEAIARLVEDTPGAEEAAHLESCAECRGQLEEMTQEVHALSLLPDMAAAPDQWASLEQRLVQEGLIRTRSPGSYGRTARLMQIAAAVTLFLGGSLAGRMTAEPTLITTAAAPTTQAPVEREPAAAPATVLASDPTPALAEREPAPQTVRRNPDVTLASSDAFGRSNPASVEDAAALLRQTEELYLAALTRYAELASQAESGDPIARLAALQSIILTTQAALNQTPTDPVINGYHLTALAQRDATLRQVAAASNERWY